MGTKPGSCHSNMTFIVVERSVGSLKVPVGLRAISLSKTCILSPWIGVPVCSIHALKNTGLVPNPLSLSLSNFVQTHIFGVPNGLETKFVKEKELIFNF